MKFIWDSRKAQANLRKHGVSFQEAVTVLYDPMSATTPDPDHSISEFRYITFGLSNQGRVLVVSHTERGETIRIISARLASKRERHIYEEV